MKKNIKGLILLFTVSVFAITIFVSMFSAIGAENSGADSDVVLGWDTEAEFLKFVVSEGFGKAKRNTDKRYIKQGNGSLYAEVEESEELLGFPTVSKGIKPYLRYYQGYFFGEANYSKAERFTVDVYNVGNRDAQIALKLYMFTGLDSYGADYVMYFEPQIAAKGRWTTLNFIVRREHAKRMGIDSVYQIDLVFENRVGDQEPVKMYIDNFRVHNTDDAVLLTAAPKPAYGMLASFESEYFRESAFAVYNSAYPFMDPIYVPTFSRNADEDFVTEGKYSLKITRYPFNYPKSHWPSRVESMLFGFDYLAKIPFTLYDPDRTDICLDVYNDYDYPLDFQLVIADNQNESAVSYYLQPGIWTTVRMPMGSRVDWSKVAKLVVRFSEYYGWDDAELYVDNMRFEIGG